MSDRATRPIGDVDRVLVVGDTDRLEDVAVSLTRALDAATLIRERSADDALARLETIQPGVDCLVCDVGTETGAETETETSDTGSEVGLERLTRLSTALPETPILAVLGDTDDRGRGQSNRRDRRDDAARVLEVGATDVLRGDESPAVVAARVRNAAGSGRGDRSRSEPAAEANRTESLLAHTTAVVGSLAPDGTIDEISPAVERRFGHTPDELEGRPLSRFVHSEDRSRLTAAIADVSSGPVGTTSEIPVRLRQTDGAWVHARLTVVNRLGDPAVDALVLTITRDRVSSTKATAEGDVAAALDRLERAVFSVGPDDDLRNWNDAATSLFAAAPEHGVVVWAMLHEAIRNELEVRAGEARAADEPVAVRVDNPSTEGHLEVTVVPTDEAITVFADPVVPSDKGTVGADVLKRDREERDLLESIVDALEDGILVLEEDRVRFANATVARLADGDQIVGQSIDDLFDAELAAAVIERAASTVVRWMDPLSGTLTVGDRRPAVEVFVAPLPAAERTLCVVRDRRRSPESALRMLDGTIAEVWAAPSHPAIRESVLRAVLDWTAADAAGWYALEGDRLEPLALETAGEHGDADRRAIEPDEELRSSLADRAIGDVTEEPALVPALTRTGIRAERVLTVSLGEAGLVVVAGPDPLGVERVERTALSALASGATLASERLESNRDLQTCLRARTRAETAADRERRVRAVERALLSANTLETLDDRLCEGLLAIEGGDAGATDSEDAGRGDSRSLEAAWVGRLDDRTGTVDPVASAGTATDELDVESFPVDADASDPASRVAAVGGGPVVVDLERVVSDEDGASPAAEDTDAEFDPAREEADVARWHRSLRERGLRWAVGVPVEHDGVRYGTLTAYAADPAAVDDEVRRRLRHLATVAGYAVGSLRRAIPRDDVTELEVAVTDGGPLTAVTSELDRRLDLSAVVPRPNGSATVYGVLSDVDADALERIVDRVDGVTAARGPGLGDAGDVGETATGGPAGAAGEGGHDDGSGRDDEANRVGVELRLSTRPVTDAVAAHGGRLRAVVPDGDRARLLLEVPTTVSVRSVVERLEREYSGVELLARRERDRPRQSWQPLETRVQAQLSDRQRRTLEAAYYGGFFEWPREQTGEDVAAALGVSQPTFSRHLRSAQRNLLSLLFEDRFDDGRT
ncbi:bacterio-opsin activator domain-containing protein [Natrarchaeobaculum aegyptiacum]|uniref:Histidine kinase n=1 Tax=Natrarchaeobaculum aegyptiacum TaxID=745377 RepID=A0A2Z2HNX8_9EURY|nr:bacterio-opsin activator domain-containing protein [Natrarchaeobaculum aegyptiacum]ARS88679.1 hypothetical protein B1756_02170 [Natrarchaeobaculum aegyptiacum]